MNGNPFYVHPGGDMTQGLQGLGQTFNQIGEQKRAEALRQEEKDIAEAAATKFAMVKTKFTEAVQSGDKQKVADVMFEFPELTQAMKPAYNFQTKITEQNAVDSAWEVWNNPDNTIKVLQDRVKVINAEGGDPSDTIKLIENELANPGSAQAESAVVLSTFANEAFKTHREAVGGDGGEGGITVGAQEILEDGTTIQSLKGGGTKVYDPEGNELKGKARADAIQVGRAEKVSNLRKAAGGKREAALEADLDLRDKVEAKVISAKDAAKASGEAFDKVEKVYQNIENLNEAIRLVEEEGAEIGAISARLPSMRSAAVKLDNLQGRLGLDVIGNTTFGALSESELKFALDVALPQKDEDLVGWAKRKVAAQEKLADYLEGAAIYLGTPGNTKVGWLERQRNNVGSKYGRTQQTEKLPDGVTEEDIQVTMQNNSLTREQVLEKLRGQ